MSDANLGQFIGPLMFAVLGVAAYFVGERFIRRSDRPVR